jgi:hypothetical protein
VVEWQSPNFQSFQGLWTLAFLSLSLVILLRARTRWRDTVPVVAFIALGLVAMRNLPAAGVVLAPALGRALRAPTARLRAPARPVSVVLLAAVVVLTAFFGVTAYRQQPVDASSYPEEAVAALHDGGLLRGHRIAHQDFVGNYMELKYGADVRVFIDDRVDMFPLEVSNDYHDLLVGKPGALDILDRRGIDVVLWENDKPLVEMLKLSGRWTEQYRDKDWVAYVRKPQP